MKTKVNLATKITLISEELVGLNIVKLEFATTDNYHILERTSINNKMVWRISHVEEEFAWEVGATYYNIKWETVSEDDAYKIINAVRPLRLSDLFPGTSKGELILENI